MLVEPCECFLHLRQWDSLVKIIIPNLCEIPTKYYWITFPCFCGILSNLCFRILYKGVVQITYMMDLHFRHIPCTYFNIQRNTQTKFLRPTSPFQICTALNPKDKHKINSPSSTAHHFQSFLSSTSLLSKHVCFWIRFSVEKSTAILFSLISNYFNAWWLSACRCVASRPLKLPKSLYRQYYLFLYQIFILSQQQYILGVVVKTPRVRYM